MDFEKMMDDASLPEAEELICLDGKLMAEHERLDAELSRLMAKREIQGSLSLAGDGSGALRERIEELETLMKEHSYPFKLRAMGRSKFRKLKAAHPARKDPERPETMLTEDYMAGGVNIETIQEPLLRACIVDPVLSDARWSELAEDKLTDGQWERLFRRAWELNQGKVDIPFSRAALLARRTTDED